MKMPKELFKEWMEARPKTKPKNRTGLLGSQNKAYQEAQDALDDNDDLKEKNK